MRRMAPLALTLTVTTQGSEPALTRRPATRIALRPRTRDTSDAGGLGIVAFRRDAAGTVDDLSVVQGRTGDRRFTRQRQSTGSF